MRVRPGVVSPLPSPALTSWGSGSSPAPASVFPGHTQTAQCQCPGGGRGTGSGKCVFLGLGRGPHPPPGAHRWSGWLDLVSSPGSKGKAPQWEALLWGNWERTPPPASVSTWNVQRGNEEKSWSILRRRAPVQSLAGQACPLPRPAEPLFSVLVPHTRACLEGLCRLSLCC